MRPMESYDVANEQWRVPTNDSRQWAIPARVLRFIPKAPDPLADLLGEISRSREILELPDDWNDEGACHFDEATWRRATEFLKQSARLLLVRSGVTLPTPRILPGSNGGIDLHWETGLRELLINVPPGNAPAGFYGEAMGTNSIKGKVAVEATDLGLFKWLTEMN